MKRILLLTPFYRPFIGGAERFAEEIASRAPSSLLIDIYTARTKRHLPVREIIDGVTIYRLGFGCAYDKFFFPFLSATKALFHPYDVTHAVMASYAGAAALFIYWLKRTPYILTLQSGTLDTPAYARAIWLVSPLYKAIHRNARTVHAASESLRLRALSLGVNPQKISVIPNGINCYRYESQNIIRIPLRIITAARLERVKGVRYVIEAMERILVRFPDVELVIVGDGSERTALELLVREKSLHGKVIFKGSVAPHKVPAFLMTGSVFVCPSLAEGFGIVILEAMASGCAVIATNVGGIPDIITDGADGLLVPPADAPAIASAACRIFSDALLHVNLISSGATRVHAFDWQNSMPRIFNLYESKP